MSKSIGNVVDPQLVIEVCSNAYSASIQSFFHLFHPFTPAEMFFFPAPLLKWLRSTQGGTQAPLPPPTCSPPNLASLCAEVASLVSGGQECKGAAALWCRCAAALGSLCGLQQRRAHRRAHHQSGKPTPTLSLVAPAPPLPPKSPAGSWILSPYSVTYILTHSVQFVELLLLATTAELRPTTYDSKGLCDTPLPCR